MVSYEKKIFVVVSRQKIFACSGHPTIEIFAVVSHEIYLQWSADRKYLLTVVSSKKMIFAVVILHYRYLQWSAIAKYFQP